MKKIIWLLIITAISFNFGCSSSDDDEEEIFSQIFLSRDNFNDININGTTLKVTVNSEQGWSASSDKSWCTVSPTSSLQNIDTLVITIAKNSTTNDRSATIRISTSKGTESIKINQNGIGQDNIGDLRYKMNVIFHVLYQNRQDPLQYVDANRINEILRNVNKLFTNSGAGNEINVEFVMAQKDPNGNTMSTPGIEYINMGDDYPINETLFMNDISGKYFKLIWDPNQYINVMLFNYSQGISNSITLGIAHLPFSTIGKNYLDGLPRTTYTYLTLNNISYPLCASANSLYINRESTPSTNSSYDINVTLAHELGHYLGLLHTFSQDVSNPCQDVDYCEDTPYYNRFVYDFNLNTYIINNDQENLTFNKLVKRTGCDGSQFESHNIMDYAISYSDQFTVNQAERMRHVMEYSPLIPGPKRVSTADKRSIEEERKLDLPFKVVSCGVDIMNK